MNIDLLTKLVKLANNNPNENEANLAARKVCKIIEEGKFDFGHIERVTERPYEKGTWGDVKRSTEPQWSSKPSTGSSLDWENILRKMNEERARAHSYDEEFIRQANEEHRRKQKEYEDKYRKEHQDNQVRYDFYGNPKKEPKPKRSLQCTICGTIIETAFVGVEATFECNGCVWERYNRRGYF